MTVPVRFSRRADRNADAIYAFIAHQKSHRVAGEFIERLFSRCFALGNAPASGTVRPELGKNVRVIGFEDAVTIYFALYGNHLQVLKLSYRGARIRLRASF